MRILLLNDTLLRGPLEHVHEVRACGPVGHYPMPDQGRFDFTYPAHTEQSIEAVFSRLEGFTPDLVIHGETTTNFFYRGIERLPCLTVWRTIDNHIHAWQPRYAPTHDLVLVAQRDYLPAFRATHPYAYWLPLNAFPAVHVDRGLERDVDVAFVGSLDPAMHPERARFFEALRRSVPVEVRSGLSQPQVADLYGRAKIVVNQCVYADLNYRVFEAMANGALLLTPAIANGQDALFQDRVELVTYPMNDAEAAARLCQYYLEHEDERQAIAARGRATVQRAHGIEHRAAELMPLVAEVGEEARAGRPARLSRDVWRALAPVFAALHSQRYVSANLAIDALDALAKLEPAAALGFAIPFTRALVDSGRTALAQPYLAWAAARAEEDTTRGAVLGLLGRVRMAEGRLEEALELLTGAIEASDGAELRYASALCLEGLGERERGLEALDACLRREPSHAAAARLRAHWQAAELEP